MRAALLATALLLLPAQSAAESAHEFRLAETKRAADVTNKPIQHLRFHRYRRAKTANWTSARKPKLSRAQSPRAAKPATRIAFPPPAKARVEGFLERFNAAYQPTK